MNKHKPKGVFVAAVIFTLCILSPGCLKEEEAISVYPSHGPGLEIIEVEGRLYPVPGSKININNLDVLSFAGSSNMESDGSFTLNAVNSENFQVILFNSKKSGETVYMGLYDPVNEKVTASDTTTALALMMINPYFLYAEYEHLDEFFSAARQNNRFTQLVEVIRQVHTNTPEVLFDFEANPVLYQLSIQIMRETLITLGGKASNEQKFETGRPPEIEEGDKGFIQFGNPRHVYYVGGVYPNDKNLDNLVLLERVERLVNFKLTWPPLSLRQTAYTPYRLNDGYYRIYVAKGFDLSKLGDRDPVGRGTLYNMGTGSLYLVKSIIGVVPMPNIITFPKYVKVNAKHVMGLSIAYVEKDAFGAIITFCEFIIDNLEGIVEWIWQDVQENATAHFLKSASGILKNVCLAFKILGMANEEAPFFYDLVAAPKEVTYFITMKNGEITAREQNNAPVAGFSINPVAGAVGTVFTFDASSTTDDRDGFSELLFRWDLTGNSHWDIDWGYHPVISHTYTENGAYSVVLEVKDTGGMVGAKTQKVYVGGGAGSANHVKLFRDNLPWSSNAMVNMLQALGFTEGAGPNQYQIIPSSQMSSIELIPGADLVIISNDQNQSFYNNYASSQIRFNNFVFQGGSLFWEACDNGWAEGSMSEAGIILPGNVKANYLLTYINYLANQNLPLVQGLPYEMDHNYASHEHFTNLSEGTIVYCTDTQGMPTLIEFDLGLGWVIITGQPLEHQYERIYERPDMEELLPRIVSYFTGRTFKYTPPAGARKPEGRSSSREGIEKSNIEGL